MRDNQNQAKARTCERSKGFTLIELLVVIAIIAILASILFPVFMKAKQTAQMTKCMSNMKQIGTALELYKGDWHNNYPYSATYPNPPGMDGYSYGFWMKLINRYSKARDLFKCPAAKFKYAHLADGAELRRDFSAANYGINEYMIYGIWGQYHNESTVIRPSKTALIADCSWVVFMDWHGSSPGLDGINLPGGMLRMKYPNSNPPDDYSKSCLAERHDRASIVFADCHAKSIPLKEFAFQGRTDPPDANTVVSREYPLIRPDAISLK